METVFSRAAKICHEYWDTYPSTCACINLAGGYYAHGPLSYSAWKLAKAFCSPQFTETAWARGEWHGWEKRSGLRGKALRDFCVTMLLLAHEMRLQNDL